MAVCFIMSLKSDTDAKNVKGMSDGISLLILTNIVSATVWSGSTASGQVL